ncbi:MAG: hypothetical protein JWM85_308 [Acidimicrobiaceae bacterium]|nr:hypothetical protein [Acidimicrobiaceae bacterium]
MLARPVRFLTNAALGAAIAFSGLLVASPLAAAATNGVRAASAAAVESRSGTSTTTASTTPVLLALGDSLAAGYQPTDGQSAPPVNPASGHSDAGYPGGYAADLARAEHLRLVDLACPGETTTSFTTNPAVGPCTTLYRNEFGVKNQLAAALAELGRTKGNVALVVFDLGANDVDSCYTGGSLSPLCVAQRAAQADRRLPGLIRTVKATLAKDDPHARFAAMDYYDPFLGLAADPGGTKGLELAALSLAGAESFDTSLRLIYRNEGLVVANVSAAFRTGSALPMTTYGGKKLALDAATVCRWTWMCPLPGAAIAHQDIHPNTTGYSQIAAIFEQALRKAPTAAG